MIYAVKYRCLGREFESNIMASSPEHLKRKLQAVGYGSIEVLKIVL